MKIINITLPLLLALFFGGCAGEQNYGYQKKEWEKDFILTERDILQTAET